MSNSDEHIETDCPAPDCENTLFLLTDAFVDQDTVTCYGCGRELTLTLSAKGARQGKR